MAGAFAWLMQCLLVSILWGRFDGAWSDGMTDRINPEDQGKPAVAPVEASPVLPRLDPIVHLPPLPDIVPPLEDGNDLVSEAEGCTRVIWPCIFGGPPIVIETFPDGRASVNGKFVETPAQTVAGFAASIKKE